MPGLLDIPYVSPAPADQWGLRSPEKLRPGPRTPDFPYVSPAVDALNRFGRAGYAGTGAGGPQPQQPNPYLGSAQGGWLGGGGGTQPSPGLLGNAATTGGGWQDFRFQNPNNPFQTQFNELAQNDPMQAFAWAVGPGSQYRQDLKHSLDAHMFGSPFNPQGNTWSGSYGSAVINAFTEPGGSASSKARLGFGENWLPPTVDPSLPSLAPRIPTDNPADNAAAEQQERDWLQAQPGGLQWWQSLVGQRR